MSEISCPRCGNATSELQSIDGALAAKIKESGGEDGIPPQVCMSCFSQLAGSVARGSVLVMREKAKEQKKLMLWKSRVNLIKNARQKMGEKAFSEAAVLYEKYLRVLEVVMEVKSGELTPEVFKDSARTQELTVVASTYWDLLRIYDTSERYGERMKMAASKLALFLRFTPIFPDIVRRAEVFQKTAKNPDVIKSFLKAANNDKSRCFIATSAFESSEADEVIILRAWRDEVLEKNICGRLFVKSYYAISPPFALFLDKAPALKAPVRKALRLFINRAVRQ